MNSYFYPKSITFILEFITLTLGCFSNIIQNLDKSIVMHGVGECPFCNRKEETINHLFVNCDLIFTIWSITSYNCPSN